MRRRSFLLGSAAITATTLIRERAHARGRTPSGGRISFRLPWAVASIDPHRIDDPAAAILAEALFDSLYTQTSEGQIVPSLAEADPEPDGAQLRVKLRTGLRTAKDKPFT